MAMKHASHKAALPILRVIEKQAHQIVQMVEEERYCVDILTALRSTQTNLKRVEDQILGEHVVHCVAAAVETGDIIERERKIAEVRDALRGSQ